LVDITDVAEKIYMIDNQMYSLTGWGSTYLIDEEQKALIDPGPATSAKNVLEGMDKVGVKPADIDHLIVTHVHLDHAGGAGLLLREMPKAQVFVHQRGARHIIDPSRLMSSARAARGEEGLARDGEMLPVSEERVKPVNDGDTLRLSEKQILRFIDAPGHAPHELCVRESRNNGLFLGDAIGTYLEAGDVVFNQAPPPGFDAVLFIETLEKLKRLKADRLYFGHFGVVGEAEKTLQRAIDQMRDWDSLITAAIKEQGIEAAGEKIREKLYAEIEPLRKSESIYQSMVENSIPLNIAGLMKYYRDKYEREQAEG
jgi:glyoxylase-like metal-dependent hydrolase (beta-lactamase superfamily II)